ncbi:sensor histidine kinase [Paractinoplanes ferrugineus]|uniref:histidine kinase n=1 Tax=Paractinoplanes ferrugineus TaxID=113564 RepID=A0A919MJR2_9ACTN|nr:histidine kinase [Actinoplanes ferrugineus]GIE15000.1 histidine kinase [Actinoplanes ferrugineus]
MPEPHANTALAALRRGRFLASSWPWRSLAFLITTAPLASVIAIPFGLLTLPWLLMLRWSTSGRVGLFGGLLLFLGGAVLVAGLGPLVAWPLAEAERVRLRLVDNRDVVVTRSRWRRLGYAVFLVTGVPIVYSAMVVLIMLLVVCALSPALVGDGPVSFGVVTINTSREAVPYSIVGALALIGVPFLMGAVAGAHAALARGMLHAGTSAELRAELVEVSRSRARLAGAFEAERRRIERDLHDGAQQQVVGLALQISLASLDVPAGSPAGSALEKAQVQAKELMGNLRELIHGIRPQLLTELGLPAALQDLAGRSAVPTRVDVDLPRRPPEDVEATVYFVVAEALANVAKHSGASSAAVTVRWAGELVSAEVTDDGRGGADPAHGSGLLGLADRAAVGDGRMYLSSPAGGPTVIRVELPCRRK